MAVKGGNGEYIKKGCKSDMDTKRPINDRHKVLITDADCTVTN